MRALPPHPDKSQLLSARRLTASRSLKFTAVTDGYAQWLCQRIPRKTG